MKSKKMRNAAGVFFLLSSIQLSAQVSLWPKDISGLPESKERETQITSMLNEMTLEQKIAQMIQPEIRDISVEDMRRYGFGSYLNGGGSFPYGNKQAKVADWVKLADDLYRASVDDSLDGSSIPTMWGTDAVHGHNNVIGATLFPHNIGLGAANNPELISEIARATALEVQATGIEWIFAPTVATVRDDRWGRTYEGYSEDPEIVKAYSAAIVKGLQGSEDSFMQPDRVISTIKHFLGDGGTVGGDDQGDNIDSEADLVKIHAQGYVSGIQAGALTVMASFNSWHGKKIHGSKYLLTDVLKERMGFRGFIVGDWSGHGQVQGCSNESCPQAINAGLDMFMAPTQAWRALFTNTLQQARDGEIPMSRIDDAVRRILRVKLLAGVFERPAPSERQFANKTHLIGAPEHREIARRAVRQSLVLLKNKNQLLPLNPAQHILVTGDGADNIGKQSGGWTITWQGTGNKNSDFPGATSIYQGIAEHVQQAGGSTELSRDGSYSQKPDIAIVVFGESPYAEGHGDRSDLNYQAGDKQDLALLQKLKAQNIPVVSIFISGRPMWINAELNASDAFVAAWLPGSEGQGIADVILRDKNNQIRYPITGKLSYSWPDSPTQMMNRFDTDYSPLLPYGFGLEFGASGPLDNKVLPEVLQQQATASLPRTIFNGQTQRPWILWLREGEQRLQVNSNTHSLNGLQYRTIDKTIQEDAVQVSFSGNNNSALYFASKSHFREDLRAELLANAALSFSLKIEKATDSPLWLMQRCDNPDKTSCEAKLDLHKFAESHNQWQTIEVPLLCLQELGMEFQNSVVPFEINSDIAQTLAIADVQLIATPPDSLPNCADFQ